MDLFIEDTFDGLECFPCSKVDSSVESINVLLADLLSLFKLSLLSCILSCLVFDNLIKQRLQDTILKVEVGEVFRFATGKFTASICLPHMLIVLIFI
jgi:hypothetical protein